MGGHRVWPNRGERRNDRELVMLTARRWRSYSSDGGASWHAAELLRDEVLPDDARTPHHWLRWVARVPLPRERGDAERRCVVCCRAFDANGQSQPRVSQKHRGYLFNGWYQVDLAVEPAGGTPSREGA